MAWTTPTAPGASALVTNSFWTTQVTNNFNATMPAIVTTKGDSAWATGANALGRLAVGANNAIIQANSACTNGVYWAASPTFGGTVVIAASTSAYLLTLAVGASTGYGINITAGASGTTGIALNIVSSNGASDTHRFYGNGLYAMWSACALIFVNETSNSFMTSGITVNQDAATNEMISGKQSNVAHGMTGLAETDTAWTHKVVSPAGGALINGYTSGTIAINLFGYSGTVDTTKGNTSLASVQIGSDETSGTSSSTLRANANIFAIRQNLSSGTRFIIDSDGDVFADASVSASAWDAYDDAAMCRALDVAISDPDTIVDDRFRHWMQYNHADLERVNLVTFNDNGHHFVNYTKLARLHTGAIWQQETKVRQLAGEVQDLRAELAESRSQLTEIQRRLSPGE